MKQFICVFVLMNSVIAMAQTKEALPYYEIPEYTEAYTANSVAARMIDALGFRYYWATDGLRDVDLNYKPSESGRATSETIEHIYGLSKFIRNTVLSADKDTNKAELLFEEKRKQTLMNLKAVSDVLRNTETPIQLEAVEVPFWNMINGPISDALWHCGQVVLLRRASGNPFNSKVNVFSGKVRE
ncbi:hypothetical protein [Mariniflexile sp. AS56]|uniref:hypothetical protein n=1 Tax=Mariniflexile sp. AS56 TaxID=3063957 RepID=UPI0026F0626B|nr:hypothetical protein [Mariniflexile sp. AS56]MDO7171488.1 hypothetical protein [Mariniflexile sp. AS56]